VEDSVGYDGQTLQSMVTGRGSGTLPGRRSLLQLDNRRPSAYEACAARLSCLLRHSAESAAASSASGVVPLSGNTA
jgi:hypothetical protein